MVNQAEREHSTKEENLPELPWYEKAFVGFMYLGALYGHAPVNVDKVVHERRLELAEKKKKGVK